MISNSLLEGCVIREGPCSILAVRVMALHPRQSNVQFLRQLKKNPKSQGARQNRKTHIGFRDNQARTDDVHHVKVTLYR
ncbi:hypothetical protein PVK06_002216 [Gossypium arboreum]|uniref:Uncharacterized protein n=1 Tax=Gossypium arboreum TaxID=29729 RepID=A0ABR0R3A2_GOSAR|nr:hypothetical protein PVK06_002216 [Gossypium arboreum]